MQHFGTRLGIALSGLGLLFVLGPVPATALGPNDPSVWRYAKRCFERLRVDPKDLKGPFRCEDGKRLPTRVHGKIQDVDVCTGTSCPKTFPSTCDFPAWLDSGENCYGHSYIQTFRPASNKKVRVALLCRHKLEWTDAIRNFDDIAMIVHNEGNGETCWFQSDTDDVRVHLNGKRVPGPAHVRTHLFWLRPTETANIGCVRCHDSSPFMVSPWMRRGVEDALDDKIFHPYKNSEKPFDRWPEPRFVEVEKLGLRDGDRSCTSCHKIAAGVTKSYEIEGFPRTSLTTRTCSRWIDWATGAVAPDGDEPIPGQNGTRSSRNVWMPDFGAFGKYDHAEFESRYRSHVDHVKKCCELIGKKKPGAKIPLEDCRELTPKLRDPGGRTAPRVRRRGVDEGAQDEVDDPFGIEVELGLVDAPAG